MQDSVNHGVQKLFGSSIHYMFEKFFSLKNGYKSMEKFIGAFRYHWLIYTIKIKHKDRVRVRDPKEIQDYLAKGTNILKAFWYENLPHRTGQKPTPTVEKSFNIRFKGHTLVGKIDRIQPTEDDEYEIWDYKTGYKKPTAPELARDIQFTAYNLAMLKATGKNPIKMRMVHPSTGEHFLVPIRTNDDYVQLGRWLDEARIYVQNILEPWRMGWKDLPFKWFNPEDIERKIFPKRPSSFCSLCDFEELCRASQPTDELRKRWVEQELKHVGPGPTFTQLDLFSKKTKTKKP
jgi:CRISPR/Cas system-associated exonuclease Cas4 (RecB family)